MRSLQSKLMTFSFISMILLILVLGSLSITSMHKVIDSNANTIMEKICESEKGKVNDILNGIEQSVDIMANLASEDITSLDMLNDEVEFEEYNDRMAKLFINISLYTPGALSLYYRYNVSLFGSKAGFWYGLKDGKMTEFPTTDISLYDKDDMENAAWYYIPYERGKASWLEPYHNDNFGIYMISYVVPIYYGETFIGVVGMDIDISVLSNMIDNISIYEDGYAYLINNGYKIIYHKDLAFMSDKPELDTDYIEVEQDLTNDMILVLTASKKVITKEGNDLLFKILIYSAILLALGLLLMYYFTSKITKPLKELTLATQKVEEGDYNINITYQSNDEVGMLSTSFQKTIDALNDKMEYINKLAYEDSLTGLYNNTAYIDHFLKINKNIENARFAIVVLDVNDLKLTNDKYGHETGNDLLIKATKFISSIYNKSNVYRIGGDEFVVILEDSEYERKEYLLKTFIEGLKNQYLEKNNQKIKINIAIGMSEYNKDKDKLFENVFVRADKLMYINKEKIKTLNNSDQVEI